MTKELCGGLFFFFLNILSGRIEKMIYFLHRIKFTTGFSVQHDVKSHASQKVLTLCAL